MSVANHRVPFRTLRGGTQVFQPDTNQAGTIGTFLTSDGVDRWLLTAFHVVARGNASIVATDRLAQPTLANGVIATLANVRSDPVLDCAAVLVALPVADEVLGIGALAAADKTISVFTLSGHPLVGWRFWRVSQLAPGRLNGRNGGR